MNCEIFLNFFRHQDDDALTHFESALSFNEQLAEAHYRKALLIRERQQYQQSLSHLLRATQLSPQMAAYWFELGQTYHLHLHSPELAEEPYRDTILLNPGHPFAYFYLGQVVKDESVRQFYFTKASLVNPNDVKMLSEVATYHGKKFAKDAIRVLQQALKIVPNSVTLLAQLVRALHDDAQDVEPVVAQLYNAWNSQGKLEQYYERHIFDVEERFHVSTREYFEVNGVFAKKWEFFVTDDLTSEEFTMSCGSYLFSSRLAGKITYHLDKYMENKHETFAYFDGNRTGPACSYASLQSHVQDAISGKMKCISSSTHAGIL